MSDAKPPEELGLETALEVLEAPLAELEARLHGVDDATAAVRKPHLEALVQLAWSLPAEPPSAVAAVTARSRTPRLLSRSMARLRAMSTSQVGTDERRAS